MYHHINIRSALPDDIHERLENFIGYVPVRESEERIREKVEEVLILWAGAYGNPKASADELTSLACTSTRQLLSMALFLMRAETGSYDDAEHICKGMLRNLVLIADRPTLETDNDNP